MKILSITLVLISLTLISCSSPTAPSLPTQTHLIDSPKSSPVIHLQPHSSTEPLTPLYSVNNETSFRFVINVNYLIFTLHEVFPQPLPSTSAQFIFTNDIDFDPDTPQLDQININRDSNPTIIRLALGHYLQQNTDLEYVLRSTNYLIIHSLALLLYNSSEATDVSHHYLNLHLTNPVFLFVFQISNNREVYAHNPSSRMGFFLNTQPTPQKISTLSPINRYLPFFPLRLPVRKPEAIRYHSCPWL